MSDSIVYSSARVLKQDGLQDRSTSKGKLKPFVWKTLILVYLGTAIVMRA